MLITCNLTHRCLRDLFPPQPSMTVGLAGGYGEHAIEQEHTFVNPRLECRCTGIGGIWQVEVFGVFLEDIDQRLRQFATDMQWVDCEAQTHRVAGCGIRVLPR